MECEPSSGSNRGMNTILQKFILPLYLGCCVLVGRISSYRTFNLMIEFFVP